MWSEDNMDTIKKITQINEKGFALMAALIASLILMAVGLLVINMSTGDLRTSAITVGDKKALAATESGIHRLVQDFNPDSVTWTTANNYTSAVACASATPSYIWRAINSGIDAHTQFAFCTPTKSPQQNMPVAGSDMSGFVYARYDVTVIGQSTSYNSLRRIDIGIGYGPVPAPQ